MYKRQVLINNIIRVDHISAALGHLFPVLAQDHSMTGTFAIRLRIRRHANVIKELMPEPAVQQMQRSMLHAAVIPVHRTPISQCLFGSQRIVVVGLSLIHI